MPAQHPSRRRRRINGDGSVYTRQQDGYWVGAFYARTTSGARKRIVYGKTFDEARDKLGKAQQEARPGIPVPDQAWRLGPYLDY